MSFKKKKNNNLVIYYEYLNTQAQTSKNWEKM